MQTVINSIDLDLEVIRYNFSELQGRSFYLLEQSSIQVLREFPVNTPISVVEIFSERARIQNRVQEIKEARSVQALFNIIIPLIENGCFPSKDFTIMIDNKIEFSGHDDGEVNLIFPLNYNYRPLMDTLLSNQGYTPALLDDIIARPNLYHKLIRPNNIESRYESFDQLIEMI